MKKSLVIELYEFSPIEGIDEESLLKAIQKAQSRFFRKQDGFISAELLRTQDKWINISYWNTKEEAEQAQKDFLDHSSHLPFVQMVSPISERRIYLKRIMRYKSFNSSS